MKRSPKRWIIPVLLFAAVFAVEFLLQRFTFLQKEYFGLFLNTPDYLNEVHDGPRPLLTLAGDFLSQFYRAAWIGPALTALLFTLGFLLLRLLWRRSTRADLLDLTACIVAVAALLFVVLQPDKRERERWAKVEYGCLHHQWDRVLAAATPEAATDDPMLMPYAFLALSEQGVLAENIFRYPVTGPQDIDMEGELTRHGYFFSEIQAEVMGCSNEAIHNAFQVACTLPHGTSLGTIRSLIKYNLAAGNATLARKYADILARNPLNRATARAARRIADQMDGTPNLLTGPSDSAATITHNTLYNMKLMAREGLFDTAAADRTRCLLMLQRDLRSLVGTFPEDENYAQLPVTYQQALCLVLDPQAAERLSPQVLQAFEQYSKAFNQPRMKGQAGAIMPGSYWDYYFLAF